VILRVTTFYELIHSVEVDHEVEGLGEAAKVLLHTDVAQFLLVLKPDQRQGKEDTSDYQKRE
jgi:hypothetical protein